MGFDTWLWSECVVTRECLWMEGPLNLMSTLKCRNVQLFSHHMSSCCLLSLSLQLTSPDEFECVMEWLQDLSLPFVFVFFFVPFLNQAQSVSTVLTLFGLYAFIFKCANCVLLLQLNFLYTITFQPLD